MCTSKTTITVTPVGNRITNSGLVAYFPPEIWVKSQGIREGNQAFITYDYGIVKNVGSSSTTVEIELSFQIHPTAAPLYHGPSVSSLWAVMNNGTGDLGVSYNSFNVGGNVSRKLKVILVVNSISMPILARARANHCGTHLL